ncbi:MAG: CRTAC1 family protein [Acidobacteriota bacterium]
MRIVWALICLSSAGPGPAIAVAGEAPTQEARFRLGPQLAFRHLSGAPDKAYILETMGSGVALFDYDGDGDHDIYLVNASTLERLERGAPGEANRLFRNDGGWRFSDVTERSGVGHRGFGQGVAVGDTDNDGDLDLYVTNYGPNVLYRNNGDGTFSETPVGVEDGRWGTSAAFGDIEGDGDLDLYVCNYLDFDRELLDRLIPRRFCLWKGLQVQCGPKGFPFTSGALYRSRRDGTFENWTERAGVASGETYQLGSIFADLDLDGDPDLYVATDTTINLLFENSGDGRFRDLSIVSGAGLSQAAGEQAGMGVDSGDMNGDGLPDLFVTNFSADYNTVYLNQGRLSFTDATDVAGLAVTSLPYLGWSTRLADLDADGDLDIFLVNGHVYPQVDGSDIGETFRQPLQLFWNRGDGTYQEAREAVLAEPRAARGAALGDLDGDRDLDMVVNIMDSPPLLLENSPPLTSRVVVLTLVGREANRDAIGALVRAEVGEKQMVREVRGDRGYLSHSDARLYLGLGASEKIDRLTVQWPGGLRESFGSLSPGSYVVLEGVGYVSPGNKATSGMSRARGGGDPRPGGLDRMDLRVFSSVDACAPFLHNGGRLEE